jgi:hypothetical protein
MSKINLSSYRYTWQYSMTVGSQSTLGWIRMACDRDRWWHL